MKPGLRFAAPLCLLALVLGCAPRLPAVGSTLPAVFGRQGRCRVATSQNSPLVTEWPASEKANLEALSHSGAVLVAYSGCSMRVLSACRVRGTYRWQRTTPSTDTLEIDDADELYARLPLGAASLEAELQRAGKLSIQTTVAGQLRLEEDGAPSVPADGPCAQATHLVTALAVGAFTLTSGGSTSLKGSAGVAAIGEAGGRASRSASIMRAAGDPAVCGAGTDEGPQANCASPIQVFLAPLPGRVAEEGPPGAVKVDFVSGNPASRWDVYADDQVVCTTPCARWVDPHRPVMLRTREGGGFMGPPSDRVQVPNLLAHAGQTHLQLQAHGTAQGKLVTGITFTALSGMAALTGVTLTALGCAGDRSGLCTGGLISLGAGGLALIGSVYLILDARARAELVPHDEPPATLARRRGPGLLLGPGTLAGTF
jgi:hypothetical protein